MSINIIDRFEIIDVASHNPTGNIVALHSQHVRFQPTTVEKPCEGIAIALMNKFIEPISARCCKKHKPSNDRCDCR
ncbi:hypothetical protein D3C72_2358520 [compost metagenome]